ncbi:MAG: prephenate dehydratase [Alphaproteobacteria bacterium]|jgi:prephenate dehydratase|nr:prephenate dehydratase [Alphaproteobacteria bacterium]
MANKIIIQGEQGAYSHLAAIKIFKNPAMICCKTFEDAFIKTKSTKNSKLLIPIENSIAGRVADVHYLLSSSRLKIEGEHFQRVEHCLLGLKDASIKKIETVRSHAQAIGQCKKNIHKLKLQPIVAADTAGSAKYISEHQIESESAIASALAAKIYGLKILKKNFEDLKGNVTRFLIMSASTRSKPYKKNKKYIISCIFRLKSVPSALHKALGGFAENKVNLTKLESFSTGNSFKQVSFYLDIEGHIENLAVKKALTILKKHTEKLDILGVYFANSFRY